MNRIVLFLAIGFLLSVTFSAKAGSTDQYNLGDSHLAIDGYDPVSYFESSPTKGRDTITAEVDGVVYRFASEANRDKFKSDPAKYKPAYGGWCATAMAKGKKVEVDPLNFKITNGRLFLFYKNFIQNAKNDWNKDEPKLTQDADREWKKFAGE